MDRNASLLTWHSVFFSLFAILFTSCIIDLPLCKDTLVGTWKDSQGNYFTLNEDGTCIMTTSILGNIDSRFSNLETNDTIWNGDWEYKYNKKYFYSELYLHVGQREPHIFIADTLTAANIVDCLSSVPNSSLVIILGHLNDDAYNAWTSVKSDENCFTRYKYDVDVKNLDSIFKEGSYHWIGLQWYVYHDIFNRPKYLFCYIGDPDSDDLYKFYKK